MITGVELPAQGFAEHHTYLKVRGRHFLCVCPGFGRRRTGDGRDSRFARLASHWGASHINRGTPDQQAESMLVGQHASLETFRRVAEFVLRDAQASGQNQFKIPLAQRAIVRALRQAAAGTGISSYPDRTARTDQCQRETPAMTTAYIGQPTSRVDGHAKVTGAAKYAAEYLAPELVHGWIVSSAIARGSITRLDTTEAMTVPGVLQVLTHQNNPGLAWIGGTAWLDRSYQDEVAPPGSPFRPLHDADVRYSMQPIALVIADTLETARYASTLVRVEYVQDAHQTDLDQQRSNAFHPTERSGVPLMAPPRGDADEAFRKSAVKLDAEYLVPAEHHNPMELFATTVFYEEGGKLTVYDKTQGCQNVQGYLCSVFNDAKDDLRVVSPFVGGAFGSGLRPQYQVFLAVLAARALKRSVRVAMTRQQMFSFGYRPMTWQHVALERRRTVSSRRSSTRPSGLLLVSKNIAKASLPGPVFSITATTSGKIIGLRRLTCIRRSTCGRPHNLGRLSAPGIGHG